MKRFTHYPDIGTMEQEPNGDYVTYADAIAASCPQDSQEGFRAFLARRGVSKFHSLYGAVLREIDVMESDYDDLCAEAIAAKTLILIALAHLGVDADSACRLVDAADYLKSQVDALPANWTKDSRLETWFPLTAEKVTRLENENDSLKDDALIWKSAFQEWKNQESIRNGDLLREHDQRVAEVEQLTQQLATELKRNTALRAELEMEVIRTADAYRDNLELQGQIKQLQAELSEAVSRASNDV